MKRPLRRFSVYRDGGYWYVSGAGWPVEAQMYRFATRKIAINGLLSLERGQFGPWCLPVEDDE